MTESDLIAIDSGAVLGISGEVAAELGMAGVPSKGAGTGLGLSPIDVALAALGAQRLAFVSASALLWAPRGPQQQGAVGTGVTGIESSNAQAAGRIGSVGIAAEGLGTVWGC